MSSIKSFEGRFEYLKLNGIVGSETFGMNRYLNQRFYQSNEWRRFRRDIIIRDRACDLGIDDGDHEIYGKILIHHINPITEDDIYDRNLEVLMDPENAVCVSYETHQAIHYNREHPNKFPNQAERYENDTIPWR